VNGFKRAPATVVIIDDHPLVREGVALRLSMYPEFSVAGEAAGEDEALRLVKTLRPDLAIVDISLQNGDGLSLLGQIKTQSPHTRTLVLSGFQESLYAERCLRAGASGYLNKQESNNNLVDAVRTVISGKRYISAWLAERLVNLSLGGNTQEDDPIDRLTTRELEVFRKIGEGMTSGMIADNLILSKHTVDTHRENIKRKLGLQNAVELTRAAVQWVLRA
jgi:DNA-binding NarL/FixJ family response regulator